LIEDLNRRYPVRKRTQYTQSVGKLLPHRISQILQELGFKTWINHGQTNGVDIKVYDSDDHLILVAEVLNWSIGSWISENRKGSMINNLLSYGCKKVLIYTPFSNENEIEDVQTHGISLMKIDYQLLPKDFYDFYASKNQVESRKIDSRETRDDIKSKIEDFLSSKVIDNEHLIFDSLLGNKRLYFSLPFKKRIIMRKAQRLFECIMRFLFKEQGSKLKIKTMRSKISTNGYLRKIVKSIFECLITNLKFSSGNFTPPDTLYHGTTNKFLAKILREGLIPSAPGHYWDEDKHKWIEKVDLTDSMYAAEYFALIAVNRFGGKPIIIEVDVSGLKDELKVRLWYLPTKCVIDAFKEIYFTRVIPSRRIKNWYYIPSPSIYELVNLIINRRRLFS